MRALVAARRSPLALRGRHTKPATLGLPPRPAEVQPRAYTRARTCICMAMDRPTGAGKGRAAPAAACAARGARPSPGNETGLRRRPGSSSGYWFWNWVKQKKSPVGLRSTCTCTCCCCLLLLAASLPATCRLIFASMRAPVSPSWRRHMVRVHGNDALDSLRSQLSTRGNSGDYSS